MEQIGFGFPANPRKTALYEVEEWYQKTLANRLGRAYEPIKRSNFGEYAMAVNYLTSVLEEAKAIEKVAIFNIDHMAQIRVSGPDAINLLERVLPVQIGTMRIGQCKYTLLLSPRGTVIDDLIIMRLSGQEFILVINAGHDLTCKERELISDADYINSFRRSFENVAISDISDRLVKIDVQGLLSYRLIKELYGESCLRNRNNPDKNMSFFTFNEFDYEGNHYLISRTGYTNRWGWELYLEQHVAEAQFKRIALKALELGGLVVGLGGRDENRISAGNFGLPLNGSEYDRKHTPVNCPLFSAAIDLTKTEFVGKEAITKEISAGIDKRMVLFITEGIVTGRAIYRDGKRLGSVTSSINSPNVSQEKRVFIGSSRKNVNEPEGTAAIGIGWLYHNPFDTDSEGNDILEKDGQAVRIRVEFYREAEKGEPTGKAIIGYISGDGVNPATASKPLKHIENL
ncbi:MAG: aminomethyltransferase family protein [Candidatus Cloacimonetes bacterium]|nr:aminomethyltransferase family protein [Candidatus Cloacimonadota bacterium]